MDIHYRTGVYRERDPNSIELENTVFSKMQNIIDDTSTKDSTTNKSNTNNVAHVGIEQAMKELLNDDEYMKLYGGESFDNKL